MSPRALLALLLLAAPVAAAQEPVTRTTWLPVLGSAPETGGQFGVALFRTKQSTDSLGTRPTSLISNAVVTAKGQQRAFVEYDRWTAGNARRLQLLAIVSRFPLPFYDFGDDTPDDPIAYEPRTADLSLTRSWKTGRASWTYAGLRAVATSVDGPLYVGPPCGVGFCDSGPAWRGGSYTMALGTVGWQRDTRDNIFAPARGRFLDVSFAAGPVRYAEGIGSETIARLRVDGRAYRATRRGSVWAAQLIVLSTTTETPVDQVALLGSNTLNRGYTMGRYRDREMASAQLEWRSPTTAWRGRLGMAAFGGVAVLSGLRPVSESRALPSGGVGLRFRLDPQTRSTIRVDYARGASGQSGLYVAFNEAF